jgi:GT2 family glycosyltransferase
MIDKNDTIAIGWCDNGIVDGKFAENLVAAVLNLPNSGYRISQTVRVLGNQIARQRQTLLDVWMEKDETDWLLWVDSDIVLTTEAIELLLESADKDIRPVVSGVYFISYQIENTIMQPVAVLYNDLDDQTIQHIHPLPENELIKIDLSGMGFVLMHKSVIAKLQSEYPDESYFKEELGPKNYFVGEDISFFRKLKKVGIPVYAHTGALVQHMKRFALDINYYKMYWDNIDNITMK